MRYSSFILNWFLIQTWRTCTTEWFLASRSHQQRVLKRKSLRFCPGSQRSPSFSRASSPPVRAHLPDQIFIPIFISITNHMVYNFTLQNPICTVLVTNEMEKFTNRLGMSSSTKVSTRKLIILFRSYIGTRKQSSANSKILYIVYYRYYLLLLIVSY